MACALEAALIAKHRWGTPIDRDNLLAVWAIEPNDHSTAKHVFEDLRREPYITSLGGGIKLDNSEFGMLAGVLYDACDREPHQIRSRLKHYEGWDTHDWG